MSDPIGFPSLKAFIDLVQDAKHSVYSARAESKVAHEDAFDEMRTHILTLYDKAEAHNSFMDESGAIFDCIPIEQQPALKGFTGAVPKAPNLPQHGLASGPQDEREASLIASPLRPDKEDRHGNVMHCVEGTIPMRRVTLEDLTRFPTLKDFFQKGPRGAGRPPRAIDPQTVPATHRWAHAFQVVNAGGGHSFLNLWALASAPIRSFRSPNNGASVEAAQICRPLNVGGRSFRRCMVTTYHTCSLTGPRTTTIRPAVIT